MWAKRRKEIAAIEAAWKEGKDVVSLAKDLGKSDEGQQGDGEEDEEEQQPRGKQQQQAHPDDDSIDGGGDGGEDGDDAEEQQAGGGDKARARGGEVDKRRSLRERGAGAGGKPTGEGSQRRRHRTRGGGRSLQQADGAAAVAAGAANAAGAAGATLPSTSSGSESDELVLDEAAEVARQAAEHEEQLKAMPTILQRVRLGCRSVRTLAVCMPGAGSAHQPAAVCRSPCLRACLLASDMHVSHNPRSRLPLH